MSNISLQQLSSGALLGLFPKVYGLLAIERSSPKAKTHYDDSYVVV